MTFDVLCSAEVSGAEVDLVRVLSQHFGFTFELVQEPFWIGYDEEKQIWTGTAGKVARGKSVIGIGSQLLTREFLQAGKQML